MEIRHYGDPVLRRHVTPVKRFDRELAEFARGMLETMYAARGIGLAAPQVGVQRDLLVLDLGEKRDAPEVMANPRIIRRSGEETESEGCLSIPGLQVEVPRAAEIEVRYQDVEGREHVRRGRGLWARVVQHEMDHLAGRLLVDYMSPGTQQRFEEEWPAALEEWKRECAAREERGAACDKGERSVGGEGRQL